MITEKQQIQGIVHLTCRAECKNETFCTSALGPNFLVALPTPQHPPAHSCWALAQQMCLWGSCSPQLPFNCCLWLHTGQKERTESESSQRCSVTEATDTNCNTRNSNQVQGKNSFTIRLGRDRTRSPGLWILHPWRNLSLNQILPSGEQI